MKVPDTRSGESPESITTGESDSQLAFRFALEYVKAYGDAVKAYARTFSCSRQRAHVKVDDYLRTPAVKFCLAQVTAPTETIASAGEVLASITSEMRVAPDSKDRLRAAELLLKVRGHMDRTKRTGPAGSPASVLITMVKQYANASPTELEAQLIGGGHAIRGSIGEGSERADLQRSGEVDETGEGDFLDTTGEDVAASGNRGSDDPSDSSQDTEGGIQ